MRHYLALIAVLVMLPVLNGCAVIDFLTGTTVVLQDNFGSESQWSTEDDNTAERTYLNQTYAITVFDTDWIAWSWAPIEETTEREEFPVDFTAQVDARKAARPVGQYGIIWGKNVNNFHLFKVSSDGFYRISQHARGEWNQLMEWRRSSAIDQDGSNHLKVKVKGTSIALFVNGQVLHKTTTLTFGSGEIGIFTGTFNNTPVQVHFDNFKVTTPQKGIF